MKNNTLKFFNKKSDSDFDMEDSRGTSLYVDSVNLVEFEDWLHYLWAKNSLNFLERNFEGVNIFFGITY